MKVFFFNDTATTEIYTLSLHDALPILTTLAFTGLARWAEYGAIWWTWWLGDAVGDLVVAPALLLWAVRSEEHTSELQSRLHLVCRLLLEKKKSGRAPMMLVTEHTDRQV